MSASGDGSDPRRGEISPEEREAFRRRAVEIGKRVGEVKARKAPAESGGAGLAGSGLAQAFRFAVELVVGVGVGGFVGWALDRQLGTGPWLLVLGIMLGFAAGLLNVIRAAQRSQLKATATQGPVPPIRDDEDDR
jgi:ATP synthase protein I